MFIATLQRVIHQMAKSKGWYQIERRPLEFHALITSEVAEATEEVRNGKPDVYVVGKNGEAIPVPTGLDPETMMAAIDDRKPEGEAVELADAVVRILDYAEYKGWNMSSIIQSKIKYNETRSQRHGGKKV